MMGIKNISIFIHNMGLLAQYSPQNLQVEADGVTLEPIESKIATNVKEVFNVLREMRYYALSCRRPVWIKLGERQQQDNQTEFIGLKSDQFFNQILNPNATFADSDLETHRTILLKLQDEQGNEVGMKADRDLLSQHCELVKGLEEWNRQRGEWSTTLEQTEAPFDLQGVKVSTYLKMLEYLNSDLRLEENDPAKLQDLYRLASLLDCNALLDRVAAELSKVIKQPDQTELVISLPPELLHQAVLFLVPDPYEDTKDAKQWRVTIQKCIVQIDQQLNDFKVAWPHSTADKKVDLEEERHRLEDAKINLKRSMIDLINAKHLSLNEVFPESEKSIPLMTKLQSFINLDPDRLHYVGLSYLDEIDDEKFARLMQGCPNLTHLYARELSITDAALAHLHEKPLLTSVSLRDCGKLTEKALAHLKGMPLTSVSFRVFHNLPDEALENLKGMPLTNAEFFDCGLTDKALENLKGMALTSIDIRYNKNLTNKALEILKEMPLKSIFLEGCYNIKKEAINDLKKHFASKGIELDVYR